MTDRDAILRSVLEGYAVGDDRWPVARDWLEDHGDESDRARVEAWRVQTEMSRIPAINPEALGAVAIECEHGRDVCPDCDEPRARKALRHREWELTERWGVEWARPARAAFPNPGMEGQQWLDYRAGLLHITAPLQTLRECLPKMGCELVWVKSVSVSDRVPMDFTRVWSWIEDEEEIDLSRPQNALPREVFRRLKSGQLTTGIADGVWMDYDSPELALADLEQANLPGWVLAEARDRVLGAAVTA